MCQVCFDFVNPLKCSGVLWLHFKVFRTIQVLPAFLISDILALWCVKSLENLTSIACTFAHLTCILYPLYLGKSNSHFQHCYSYILQIIYVISEANKLLRLTHHT